MMNKEDASKVAVGLALGAGDSDKWLKRTKNSEEELSEGSSSSDSNQQSVQIQRNNLKTSPRMRRPSRQSASKKRWFGDYKPNASDTEWNEDVEDSDSDPIWSPAIKQQRTMKAAPPVQNKGQRPGRKPKGWSPPKTETQPVQNATKGNNSDFSTSLNGLEMRLTFAGFTCNNGESPYESGKFIMLKSDFKRQKNPCLWRIDGKNLLQKYEPILYKGEIAFRNISTYSSWTPANQGLYIPVETEFAFQSKAETVVRFNQDSVKLPVKPEIASQINQESADIHDSFQIYLQTLISQALDANFLNEIVKEHDEYFLTSICAVEDQWVSPRIAALKDKRKWPQCLAEAMECYPIFELSSVTSGEKCCYNCGGRNPTRKFTFSTVMYHYETLIMTESNSTQEHLLCLVCTDSALIYHQLFHFRYNLFNNCASKIKEVTATQSDADGPAVLKTCLADQLWTSKMLQQSSLILAEAEQCLTC